MFILEAKFSKWEQDGKTVAGGNGDGSAINQLSAPLGIYVDQKKNIYIADRLNHRIVKWKPNENQGTIVAGENQTPAPISGGVLMNGNRTDRLYRPSDVIVDEQTNSIIIAENGNRRVIQWFNESRQEYLIANIRCSGMAKDKYGFLYVSDTEKSEVRRWKMGEFNGKEGTLVAGGNRFGNQLNQLNQPEFIFVDDEQSIYVSDVQNHRVMKWAKGAKEGIIVAGGNGYGDKLNQFFYPSGLFVGAQGEIYIADKYNHRIMRWKKGEKEGEIIVGGNGKGNQTNQLENPSALLLDPEGNLYVSDCGNHRIQKFDLIS